MTQSFRQRSALAQAAERGLYREPAANQGDRINAAVGIAGCLVIIILAAMGVA